MHLHEGDGGSVVMYTHYLLDALFKCILSMNCLLL